MSSFRSGAGVLALGFLAGCGGAKAPAEVATPAASASPEVVALPPMTKVPPSPELFAVARVANLEKAADTAVAWSGLPVNWRSLLEKEMPGLTRVAVMTAPVDFAATIDPGSGEMPKVHFAFAFGLASTDAAVSFLRQQGMGVTPREGGAYQVAFDKDLACVIDRALGAAPARIVCSDDQPGVDALLPYLTRGLPTESLGSSDIHAHVSAEPFRRRWGAQVGMVRTVGVPFLLRELSVDHPKLDRALHEVLYGGADEVVALAADADRLDFDVTVVSDAAVDVSMSIALAGQKSWWGQTMARAAGQMAAPPDTFWKLPASSTSGSYSAYSDPERFRGIVLVLRDLLDGFLDYQKMSEARRRPLVDAFEKMATVHGKSAAATLPLAPPATGAAADDVQMVKAAVGQHLALTDKGGAEVMAFFSEVTKAIGDKGIRDQLVKKHKVPAAYLPTARERALTGKNVPAGSKRYELTIPGALFSEGKFSLEDAGKKPKKGKVGPPLGIVALAVPDGPLTWFAIGTDEKALLAAVTDARAGTGPTLATREGLASLRTLPSLSGGFTTLAAVLQSMDQRFARYGKEPFATDKLPHRGMTPILFTATATAKGAGPTTTVTARVPRAVVEDSVGLAATEVARRVR